MSLVHIVLLPYITLKIKMNILQLESPLVPPLEHAIPEQEWNEAKQAEVAAAEAAARAAEQVCCVELHCVSGCC